MATLMKEKKRVKKRIKERHTSSVLPQAEISPDVKDNIFPDEASSSLLNIENDLSDIAQDASLSCLIEANENSVQKNTLEQENSLHEKSSAINVITEKYLSVIDSKVAEKNKEQQMQAEASAQINVSKDIGFTYKELSEELEKLSVSSEVTITDLAVLEKRLENINEYLNVRSNLEEEVKYDSNNKINEENVTPSAPMVEERVITEIKPQEVIKTIESEPDLLCTPLEEAIKLYGGQEIAEVRAMSEKEEMLVETGPASGPEHPLVDLLSTFRCSLMAVERERVNLTRCSQEEQRFRATLWKVEKRTVNVSKKCHCGAYVAFRASYDHAELSKDKLAVARMRLEALLKNVQDTYCHHQHAALLAYYQIEQVISDTVQGSKADIREALTLVLQSLRMSDNAPTVLASALQRWAKALAAALLDDRDLRQLLFLLHHLFRQSRSVRWAAGLVHVPVSTRADAARALALLDLVLRGPRLSVAVEATEESEELWEEVGRHGGSGAVGGGALRERDLLALLRALPCRQLVAEIVGLPRTAASAEWFGDKSGGRGVVSAALGVRALLAALGGAARALPRYPRLRARLHALAAHALHALAALHLHSREGYRAEAAPRVAAELEAAFAEGARLLGAAGLARAPPALLRARTAHALCREMLAALHDARAAAVSCLSLALRVPCEARVRVAARAAARRDEPALAAHVLHALVQTGLGRAAGAAGGASCACAGAAARTALRCVPQLLRAHPHLHTAALLQLAHVCTVERVEEPAVRALRVRRWRPGGGEARALLDAWAQRCPHLLPPLLLQLDCAPHTGISLESQLAIGWWLCEWVGAQPAPPPEWAWRALRSLRVHAAGRGGRGAAPGESAPAPAPPRDPPDAFSAAFTVLATSWGHCVPLICSRGVRALLPVCAAHAQTAAHCLAPLMAVMARSPESVALTPAFGELLAALLAAGPSLLQRTLGLAAAAPDGARLLLAVLRAHLATPLEGVEREALVSAWLHALWQPRLGGGALRVLDAALLAARAWPALDAHATAMLQEENAQEWISHTVRHAAQAPLLCEVALRAAHAQLEVRPQLWARVTAELGSQRARSQRIHVDNALKLVSAGVTAEQLVVHRAAHAALAAPLRHPAHLLLWRLFFHLYLQRDPAAPNHNMQEAAPIGPLFFSGLIKSRTLAQIKRRLQETAAYHRSEAEALKSKKKDEPPPPARRAASPTERVAAPSGDDDMLLPALSLDDMKGSASDSDSDSEPESDSEADAEAETETDTDTESSDEDAASGQRGRNSVSEPSQTSGDDLIRYHVAAERVACEYLRWVEAGEAARAQPHHADLALYMPEQVHGELLAPQALVAAWTREASLQEPASEDGALALPLACRAPPPAAAAAASPLAAVLRRLERLRPHKRSRWCVYKWDVRWLSGISAERQRARRVRSPAGRVDVRDARALLAALDRHLKEIESFAREWAAEAARVSRLDAQLWGLVAALRERRPLPRIVRACTNNCEPLVHDIRDDEWCISIGAENGIKDNRGEARAALRRLARARPPAARTAAALHALARYVRSAEAAVVAQRVWACAGAVAAQPCAPAHHALAALAEDLAERWLCHDGPLCAELVSRWCGAAGGAAGGGAGGGCASPLQQAVCGALVCPRRLPAEHWPRLYVALLDADLPPHLLFSYLSRFEMSRWGAQGGAGERRGVLGALVRRAQRAGAHPDRDHLVLLELLGVHVSALVCGADVPAVAGWCARASAARRLPPELWRAVLPALAAAAHHLPFDELGHLLRELGEIWWECRMSGGGGPAAGREARLRAQYAAHTATLLHALHRALVAAAVRLSYHADRVAWYAWSSLVEAWGPWVGPRAGAPPPLPAAPLDAPAQLCAAALQVIADCPESEAALLQQIWEWMIYTELRVSAEGCEAARAHCAALRGALAALPWRGGRWLRGKCVAVALQACLRGDAELVSWCAAAVRGARAEAWTRGVPDAELAPHLAALLPVLLALPPHRETLEEAKHLPWWRLPEQALVPHLERFFVEHHSAALPYHDVPQFRVLLYASELPPAGAAARGGFARAKRAELVSRWACAAAAPALHAHVPAHAQRVLDAITRAAPQLEDGELEQLLTRAALGVCGQPAAAAALPVWTRWVCGAPARLAAGCVSAAAALTAPEPHAALADAAARAHLTHAELGGWGDVVRRSGRPWAAAGSLAARGRLHAAYAAARAQPDRARPALLALAAADLDFEENEVIISLWIVFAGRVCGARADDEGAAEAGAALLARWAERRRRSILRAVTLRAQRDQPTDRHRLLCRLALCILSPDCGDAVKAYEESCAAVLGSIPGDVAAWGRSPHPKRLPSLATLLFPKADIYFKDELDMVAEN